MLGTTAVLEQKASQLLLAGDAGLPREGVGETVGEEQEQVIGREHRVWDDVAQARNAIEEVFG